MRLPTHTLILDIKTYAIKDALTEQLRGRRVTNGGDNCRKAEAQYQVNDSWANEESKVTVISSDHHRHRNLAGLCRALFVSVYNVILTKIFATTAAAATIAIASNEQMAGH